MAILKQNANTVILYNVAAIFTKFLDTSGVSSQAVGFNDVVSVNKICHSTEN